MGSQHECPVDGCQISVPGYLLMCRSHWAMVPSQLGRAVYAAWKDGRGAGTAEHEEACRAAIEWVNAQLQERNA